MHACLPLRLHPSLWEMLMLSRRHAHRLGNNYSQQRVYPICVWHYGAWCATTMTERAPESSVFQIGTPLPPPFSAFPVSRPAMTQLSVASAATSAKRLTQLDYSVSGLMGKPF